LRPTTLDEKHELTVHTPQTNVGIARKQRHQMLIALALLLLALILVLLKDWHFWFPAPPANTTVSESLEKSIVASPTQEEAKAPFARPTRGAAAKTKESSAASSPDVPGIVASDRAVLPPLKVEVVSGSRRRTVQPASNSVRVDLQSEADPSPIGNAAVSGNSLAQSTGDVVNATETMRISPDAAQVVSRPVEPNYPLLAKQMKVQGSVVLQALIDRAGNIEDLHVLSGPAILSSAAMQAVKQWRFRPYYMSGEAVETQARITVNFTISTY
jgi:TonB family protein